MAVRGLKLPQGPQDQSDSFVLPPFVKIGKLFEEEYDEEIIDGGAFGSIYRGEPRSGGNPKAIKVLNAGPHETVRMLKALNEAEIGMLIDHPHLLPIKDVWYDGTRFLFVMDLVEPLTVSSLPKSPKEKKEILVLFLQLVSAAVHLYSEGILHRDIKFQNTGIMRDKDGTPRLVLFDFGEACKVLEHYPVCVGTVFHMAPEVLKDCQYSDKSEIWALMSFLIEILTGKSMILHMFTEKSTSISAYEIQCKITKLTEPPIPEVFKTDKSQAGILLLQILRRGLALNPAERLSFSELQALLQELIALL
jgi:serine/threonine protein kinase